MMKTIPLQNEMSFFVSAGRLKLDLLRKLQRYMVGNSEKRKDKLGNAIYGKSEGILVLCDGYYDKSMGVTDEPKMDFYSM